MLDSLNFCFWPLEGFEYEHLAGSVKNYLLKFENEGKCLESMMKMNEKELVEILFKGADVPQADERARIIREMSTIVT